MQKIHRHLEKYWSLSVDFFEKSDWPLSCFFALNLIEEVGKVESFFMMKKFGKITKKPLLNHGIKYDHAVFGNLYVNSRVTRIYGEREKEFAKLFREKKLFELRNKSLYLELDDNNLVSPEESICRDKAFLLVCFAGEIYGEVQGDLIDSSVEEHFRIVDEVEKFRERNSP